jgi:hypothetical protein
VVGPVVMGFLQEHGVKLFGSTLIHTYASRCHPICNPSQVISNHHKGSRWWSNGHLSCWLEWSCSNTKEIPISSHLDHFRGQNEASVWKKPRYWIKYGWIEHLRRIKHSFHHYHHSQLHHLVLIYPYSLYRHNGQCNNSQDVYIDH